MKVSSPAIPSVHYWLLRPAVKNVRWYEFHRVRECIQAGEAVGRQVVDQIKTLLKTGDLAGGAAHSIERERNVYRGESNETW
jgi:NTE family protein